MIFMNFSSLSILWVRDRCWRSAQSNSFPNLKNFDRPNGRIRRRKLSNNSPMSTLFETIKCAEPVFKFKLSNCNRTAELVLFCCGFFFLNLQFARVFVVASFLLYFFFVLFVLGVELLSFRLLPLWLLSLFVLCDFFLKISTLSWLLLLLSEFAFVCCHCFFVIFPFRCF